MISANSESLASEKAPFFTIAIPTRNRARFARLSAKRVLAQDFRDLKLVILDNSDQSDLSAAEFDDVRCTVVPSTTVLSMRDNWERILDVATGKYLMLLSDKDMLLPGALTRIARAITQVDANLVNYRKACFARDGAFRSFVQRCSGRLVEKDAESVLNAWFGEVAHFHDAPMAYNSAVRREIVMELRRTHGTFFTGTSPDIGSGAVLMARLGKYHVLDRPLVVSWYGDWSIGMAASQGAKGAAAAFFAEYRDDPIGEAGLIRGVAGSVAETLLDCKSSYPALFAAHEIRWSSYIRNALKELKGREQSGTDTASELQFLRSTRGKKYSWLDRVKGTLAFRWAHSSLAGRIRRRLMRLTNGNPGAHDARAKVSASQVEPDERTRSSTQLTSYFDLSNGDTADFRTVPYFTLPDAQTVDDVVRFADAVNCRLDLGKSV
jgi:glycosyl transferase family 2